MSLGGLVLDTAQALFVCLLMLSLAGRCGRAGKYLELASHFKVQSLIAAVVCGLVFAGSRMWPWTAAALVLIVVDVAALLPYYRARRSPTSHSRERTRLRLLLSNVQYQNINYSALLKLAREEQPDVLVAQEVTKEWCRELLALAALLPHRVAVPGALGAGITLLSRFPFDHSEVIFNEEHQRPGIVVRMTFGGQHFSLLTMHTHAPLRRFHFGYRNALLAAAARVIRRLPTPVILLGDLNTSPWSPYFAALLRATKLREARRGFGVLTTWPVWLRLPFLMLPIDHCLVSHDINVIQMRTGPDIGSDHLPVIIDLALPAATAIHT